MAQDHSINVADAAKYGMAASAILNNIVFWLRKKQGAGKDMHEGRVWVYYTYESLAEQYPYLSREQVKYAVEKLVSGGVLLKGDYSRERFRRPTYYTLADNEAHRLCNFASSLGENSPPEEANIPDRPGKLAR